jgi:hypothetical protein
MQAHNCYAIDIKCSDVDPDLNPDPHQSAFIWLPWIRIRIRIGNTDSDPQPMRIFLFLIRHLKVENRAIFHYAPETG